MTGHTNNPQLVLQKLKKKAKSTPDWEAAEAELKKAGDHYTLVEL